MREKGGEPAGWLKKEGAREKKNEEGSWTHRGLVKGREKDRRQRVTPLVSLLPSVDSSPLLLSLLPTRFSRSIHHPYHPTTPGVDASRVVATGSERSNLPCPLLAPLLRSCSLSVSLAPFSSFSTLLSFSLLRTPVRLPHASSAHAHASIRDNKRAYALQVEYSYPVRVSSYECLCVQVRLLVFARTHTGMHAREMTTLSPTNTTDANGHVAHATRTVFKDMRAGRGRKRSPTNASRVLSLAACSRTDPYLPCVVVHFKHARCSSFFLFLQLVR